MTLFYYHKHLLLDCEAKDVAKWLDIMFNGHVQAFQKQLFIPFYRNLMSNVYLVVIKAYSFLIVT